MNAELPKTYDPTSVEAQAYDVWIKENSFHAEPSDPGHPYCIVIPPPNVTGALHLGHAINDTLQDILIRMHRMMGDNAMWVPGIDHAGIATQAVVEKQLKEQENKTRHDVGREALVERIWKWKQQYGDRIIDQLRRLGCSCDWDRTRFTLDDQCARAVRETFFKLFKDGLIYRGKRLVNWDIHLQTSISDDEIYHETVKTSLWHIKYPIIPSPSPLAGEGGVRGESGKGQVAAASRESSASDTSTPHPNPLPQGERGPEQDRPTHMVVATTRPETMLGDTAVAVHSQDPRWNWAIGMQVELPLTGRKIPIIADDILVDPKFGTGCVKVTPAHDPNDYAVYQRHLAKPDPIDIINILNSDGTLNENAGAYAKMKREAARKKVVEDLTHQGLLLKEEPYETQVGHSDRSKTPVEPYLSDQWFVKMAPLAEPALEVVRNGTIKFFPERHAQQYLSWLGEKRDWPISRQLWWGHRIPVWHLRWVCDPTWTRMEDRPTNISAATKDIKEGVANLQEDGFREFVAAYGVQEEIAWHASAERNELWACARTYRAEQALKELENAKAKWISGARTPEGLCSATSSTPDQRRILFDRASRSFSEVFQDPDVLDTWFSSALWPHSTLGWPEQTEALKKWYPTSVLVTGRDIITLWVARMVMTGMYNMGRAESRGQRAEGKTSDSALSPHPSALDLGIPFHHVAINPTILDGKGERMSKSKGNGVDPVDIIESHGADALRFTLTHMATETQDVRMPVKKLPNGKNTSEKFDLGRNFCNKLWNAARFVLSSLATESTEDTEKKNMKNSSVTSVAISLADRWIVSRFNATVAEVNDALSNYRFDQYARACYDFFWRDFCDWYVEASKPAMKDPARMHQTAQVLAAVLDGALRLLHPMIPFITETIWWKLNEVRPQRGIAGQLECPPSPRLIKAAWPTAGAIAEDAEHVFPRLQGLITAIRNLRNEHKVDVKKRVVVHIAPPEEAAVRVTNENREMIELLATCTIKTIQQGLAQPPNTARTVANNVCDIYVEGLVDAAAQTQRSGKQREDLLKEKATLDARLDNPGYIAKAPAHLVEQTKARLAEIEAELKKLE